MESKEDNMYLKKIELDKEISRLEEIQKNIEKFAEDIKNPAVDFGNYMNPFKAIHKKYVNDILRINIDVKIKQKYISTKIKLLCQEIEETRKKLGKICKELEYEKCFICDKYFKNFSRGCTCIGNDKYMCIECIFNSLKTNISNHKAYNDLLKCPFCNGTIVIMKCPMDHSNGNSCEWCKTLSRINEEFSKIMFGESNKK